MSGWEQCARKGWPERKEVATRNFGEQSAGESPDRLRPEVTGRKRVLRGVCNRTGSRTAKRRQRACGPMDRIPKEPSRAGRRGLFPAECNTGEVKTQGEARDLDEPAHRDRRHQHARKDCPATWEVLSSPANSWNGQREGNEACPGATRSRSAAVGAMKRGNQPEGTPQSKGRRRELEPNEGTIGEILSSPTVSTKIERIANWRGASGYVAACFASCSKPNSRRAGCGKSARPDLWGPRGNPGLPDHRRLTACRSAPH